MAMVMDNASNNDTMIEAIEDRCRTGGIKFSAKQARMRCMPHTIHLAAIKVRLHLSYETYVPSDQFVLNSVVGRYWHYVKERRHTGSVSKFQLSR